MARNEKPAAEAVEKKEAPKTPPGGYRGVARLRRVMNLSIDVAIDKLCDEAAAEIEQLRTRK